MKTLEGQRRWGEPLWRSRRVNSTSRSRPANTDVAIVGGGLTGMSAALHLARLGLRPVVFEAATVGEGASGRTGGIVLEGIASGIRPGADDCVPGLARIVEESGIECDLHLPGCWEIKHAERGQEQALPWRDADSTIRIAAMVPGGSVEPRALLVGLANAAVEAGALIFENRRVRRLDLRGGAIETDGVLEHFEKIVVGVNAWTAALIHGLPTIHSALTYALATEPLSEQQLAEIGLAERIPFYTVDTPYLWGRVAAGGEVVFGAGLLSGPPSELEDADVVNGPDSQAILDRLERRVHELNPALAKVRIPQRWAGPIAFCKGAVPLLGRHPKNPAVIVAGAYAGHGVAFGVHAGAMAARAIVDGIELPEWAALNRRDE